MTESPNVDHAELAKFDAVAHRFWDPEGEFQPLHRLNPMRLEFVATRATLPGRRVLDVGCGGGLFAEALARRGATVVGIDLAPAMIEVAALHAMEAGIKVDYRRVSAESLQDSGEPPFDVVTCMEMIEHVPDPATTIATLARLVRPDGDVFLSTLNRNLKSFALAIVGAEYVMRLLPRGTHEYERFLRPSELASFGRAAGLSLRDIAGLDYEPLSGRCALTDDPSVNYIVHFSRGA